MSRTNETRHVELHETYNCRCRLDASAVMTATGLEPRTA